MQRNQLTRAEVESILAAQASRKERLSQANTILHNDGDLMELNTEIHNLHQKIMEFKSNLASSS